MSAEDPASEQKDIASEQNLSAEDLTSEPEQTKPEAEQNPSSEGDTKPKEESVLKQKEEQATKERSSKEEKRKGGKIEIRLQATGDAPIMKQRNYSVEPGKKIGEICGFVRKYLKLDEAESLFLYVNQAFAPSPDQTILNLKECFGSDGKLVLYYSRNQAWG